MRSVAEIESRIRFLLCSELDRRVEESTRRKPHLCTHNHRQPLDTRPRAEGEVNETFNRTTDKRGLPVVQTIGLCMLGADDPANWRGDICEDDIDARRCPYFDPTIKKDVILRELSDQAQDPAWLRENMPEISALYWVLDAESARVRLPWWKRIWYRLLRVNVEPVLPPYDVSLLLPPASGGPSVD